MFVSTVLLLAFANAARAQTSTVSLMPLVQGQGLQGEVLGTGTGGTTYRLSGTFASFGIPFTATLIEDASHVSEIALIATSSVSILVHAECTFLSSPSSGMASCVETLIEPSSTTALTLTGAATLTGVPVVSNNAPLGTPSHSQISGSGTGTGVSTLPASISVTSTPASGSGTGTATVVTGSGTATGAAGSTTSSAARALKPIPGSGCVLALAWFLALLLPAVLLS